MPRDHRIGRSGHLPWRRVILTGLVMLSGAAWGAPPGRATQAYRCEPTADQTINRASCLVHQAWDSVSGGHPQEELCAPQDTLGVEHVKDCHSPKR